MALADRSGDPIGKDEAGRRQLTLGIVSLGTGSRSPRSLPASPTRADS